MTGNNNNKSIEDLNHKIFLLPLNVKILM